MDEAALLQFLLDASRRGYAAGGSVVKVQEADHSTTIVLEHGKWRFHDNYFGGEPYGGREGVFPQGRAVWVAGHYGWGQGASGDPQGGDALLPRGPRGAPGALPGRGSQRG